MYLVLEESTVRRILTKFELNKGLIPECAPSGQKSYFRAFLPV